jgi:hypothetical protein
MQSFVSLRRLQTLDRIAGTVFIPLQAVDWQHLQRKSANADIPVDERV